MPIRIIVNEKECSSRLVKFGIGLTVLVGSIAIAALIVFVLLPVIGISVAATLGLVIIISVGIFAAAAALTLGSAVLGIALLFVDFLATKFQRR